MSIAGLGFCARSCVELVLGECGSLGEKQWLCLERELFGAEDYPRSLQNVELSRLPSPRKIMIEMIL